jgi:hypothetical protein
MITVPPRLRFMRLRHHEILVALNDLGNLRKAAEQLAISQPAVTKALQEIESQMGATLFERHSKGVVPSIRGWPSAKAGACRKPWMGCRPGTWGACAWAASWRRCPKC